MYFPYGNGPLPLVWRGSACAYETYHLEEGKSFPFLKGKAPLFSSEVFTLHPTSLTWLYFRTL
jgi:hypothetical protein